MPSFPHIIEQNHALRCRSRLMIQKKKDNASYLCSVPVMWGEKHTAHARIVATYKALHLNTYNGNKNGSSEHWPDVREENDEYLLYGGCITISPSSVWPHTRMLLRNSSLIMKDIQPSDLSDKRREDPSPAASDSFHTVIPLFTQSSFNASFVSPKTCISPLVLFIHAMTKS